MSGSHEITPPEGRPLDAGTRSFFEARFGHDFGRVRVHAGGPATRAADELGASAFTFGHDIALLDARDASLGNTRDPRLLAHELAHVVQEGGAGRVVRRTLGTTPREPTPWDCAETLRAYLLFLNQFKNVPRPPPFNPYVWPTIEQVVSLISVSSEFRDKVADEYKVTYGRDLIGDIVRLSTEEEKDRLLRPFVSGKGDFPEPSKDKAVA